MKNSLTPHLSRPARQLLLASIVSLLAVSASQAALKLTYDLRVRAAGSTGIANVGAHSADVSPNAVINIDLYAIVPVASNGTDSFTSTFGSIVSSGSTGSFLTAGAGVFRPGGIASANNVPGLSDGTASFGGTSAELSGRFPYTGGTTSGTSVTGPTYGNLAADGILDLGSTVNTSAAGYFGSTSGVGSPVAIANGLSELLIGQFQLTLGAVIASGQTTIGYYLQVRTSGSVGNKFNQVFQAGGVLNALDFMGQPTGGASTNAYDSFAFNNVVLTAAPEPSAFGMLLVGALGLVGFRRLGLRRTA